MGINVVRHHDDRAAFIVTRIEHHFTAHWIKIACWFICRSELWVIHKSSSQRDSLLLADTPSWPRPAECRSCTTRTAGIFERQTVQAVVKRQQSFIGLRR